MALGIGTLISAGASILGGMMSSDASQSAASTQAQSGRDANAAQMAMFNQNRADLAPYRNVGQAALYKLSDYLGLSTGGGPGTVAPTMADAEAQYKKQRTDAFGVGAPMNAQDIATKPQQLQEILQSLQNQYGATQTGATATGPSTVTGSLLKPFSFDISQDPGYQFRLNEGNKGVENSAAARGSQLSGATLKELLRYGSDYASGEYNAAFQRDQATKAQIYGQLTGTAGMGQGATNTSVAAGTNTAANIGNTMTGIGNAQASGIVGGANALSSGISNAGSGINQAMLLKQILGNPGVNGVNAGVNLGSAGAGDINAGMG